MQRFWFVAARPYLVKAMDDRFYHLYEDALRERDRLRAIGGFENVNVYSAIAEVDNVTVADDHGDA